MSKPVLGIQLEFGFHEVKKYIHSGFAEKLASEFELVWFILDKKNPEMDTYFRSTGYPVIYYQPENMQRPIHFCETCNDVVRRSWMRNQDAGLFHNYKRVAASNWKDKLLGFRFLKHALECKALWIVQRRYYHEQLALDFKKYNVQKVLSTGYGSTFAKFFYTTAHHLNIPAYHIVNSWKDLYTNSFIGFDFLKKIFVWSEDMKLQYRQQMPYLKTTTLVPTGNPTFDACITHQPKAREVYCNKYNLHPNAHWVLYTMMPPGLVNDEWETIMTVAAEIDKFYTADQVKLIVRKNPNHTAEDFTKVLLPNNVVVADHFCTYDAVTDMIIQSEEGEKEWLDLLHHATLNLSVPSTVTMEFLTLKKPVINIGFDATGNQDERVRQHFDAGFYRNLFDKEHVYRATNIEALIPCLRRALEFNSLNTSHTAITLASDRVLQELLND